MQQGHRRATSNLYRLLCPASSSPPGSGQDALRIASLPACIAIPRIESDRATLIAIVLVILGTLCACDATPRPVGSAAWHRVDLGGRTVDLFWTECPGGRLYAYNQSDVLTFVPDAAESPK